MKRVVSEEAALFFWYARHEHTKQDCSNPQPMLGCMKQDCSNPRLMQTARRKIAAIRGSCKLHEGRLQQSAAHANCTKEDCSNPRPCKLHEGRLQQSAAHAGCMKEDCSNPRHMPDCMKEDCSNPPSYQTMPMPSIQKRGCP